MIQAIVDGARLPQHHLQRLWGRIPLLDRWLLLELLPTLFFGIASFTAVGISVGAVFELIRRVSESGLSLLAAGQILLLQLPGFTVLSFPMATLMATLLAYSRLSSTSELTALRSIGVSTRRMVVPALVVALVMSGLTFVFNDEIVPRANYAAHVTLMRGLGRAVATEKGSNVIYSRLGNVRLDDNNTRNQLTQTFYAREYEHGRMTDITVLDLSRPGNRQLLTAARGTWNESESMWEFEDGRITNVDDRTGATTSATFDRYLYPLGRGPAEVSQLPDDILQMTVGQARRAERLYREANNTKEARRMRVRIQEKFAFPVICLVFGLIGSSLGVRPNSRTSKGQGFGLSVIMIFGYYLFSFMFSSMGISGTLPPLISAWTPVAIGLSWGGYLLWKASR